MTPRAGARPLLSARQAIVGLAALASWPALSGCPGHLGPDFPATLTGTGGAVGGDDGGGGGTSGVCDAPKTVFLPSCAMTIGCHTALDFLDLTGNNIELRLIGKLPILSPDCGGMNLVNPTAPPDGVLFKLLTGPTCGSMMPLSAPPLMPDQIDCIREWIGSKL